MLCKEKYEMKLQSCQVYWVELTRSECLLSCQGRVSHRRLSLLHKYETSMGHHWMPRTTLYYFWLGFGFFFSPPPSCMDTACSLIFKPEKIVLYVLFLLMKIHSLTSEFIENVQFILIILCKQVKIFLSYCVWLEFLHGDRNWPSVVSFLTWHCKLV